MTHASQVLALEPQQAEAGEGLGARQASSAPEAADAHEAAAAEWLSLASLADLVGEWQGLAARALEPNVFYEPAFALPAGRAFGAGVGAVAIWAGAKRQRLIGLFPGRIARRRYGPGPSVMVGWTHPYAPLGTPLVDRQFGSDALAAWLDFLADQPGMPRLALLPYMTTDGPVAALVRQAMQGRGGRSACFGRHVRALLSPQQDRAVYLARAVSGKKRKELRRQRRLIGGDARLSIASNPHDIEIGMDNFLALEREGWKGRQGTAALQDRAADRFMRDAVARLAQRHQAQVVELVSGSRTMAAAIVLRSGSRAWFWKIAYDETMARVSPGVQLTVDLTQLLLDDAALEAVDSCATPDHAMIDHIWRERLDVADLLLATGARSAGAFAFARAVEATRRSLISATKALRDRMHRR